MADIRPSGMTFEPRETRPAEAETQVIDKWQFVGLIRENGVGPKKRKLEPVWPATTNIGLVQVIRCQIQVEWVGKLRVNARPLLFPLLEHVCHYLGGVYAERVHLVDRKVYPQIRSVPAL